MSASSKKSITLVHVFTALLVLSFASSLAELHRIDQLSKEENLLSFLVVGDWGRKGDYNQTEVAVQMGIIGEKINTDFIVSVDDNFYEDGLTGVFDPAFGQSFTEIYTANSLQKPWYIVLGNHDYNGDVEAQLSPILRQMDERWNCKRTFVVNTELALMESTASWKIVVGHHTIKSAGHHGNTDELVTHLLPILEANNVNLYINGHEHCLEHISSTDSSIQFLTSGGGSKAWRGDVNLWNPKEMQFYYDGQGFMSVQVVQDEVKIAFYDIFGHVLHKWSSLKQLHSSV